uniref:Putative histone-lysine N-methyltransferase set-2 n=1 Tax=Davidia involucrata TaxID=16924 RepID=A0A5B6YMV7_DAVIN
MYGHTTTANTIFSDASAHLFDHFPSLPDITEAAALAALALPSTTVILPPPPPLVIPGNEFDSMSCSSYGSPSSLASYSTQGSSLIQRSVSSHSLIQKNGFCGGQLVEFVDLESSPVRRVFSTGDLQERINMVQQYHRSESPLSNESSSIIESMNKACRYSPEEKKERIERYRSKRNQRNFNKKIKYACRKTLADSRPRIRGRFARNDEIEKSSPHQWSQVSGEEDDEEDDNWINFIDAFSANLIP